MINDAAFNQTQNFRSNYIRTTKYTALSFLPLSLLYQFMRFSNIYFLFVAILQSIPIVSPLHPMTAIFPLIFVLVVSMIREGYEDYGRYQSDKAQNSQVVKVLRKGDKDFREITSAELVVGDLILCSEGETFPADIALLTSSLEGGECFIKTSSLDGEKNLKKRVQCKDFELLFPFNQLAVTKYAGIKGKVDLELPNKDLHSFKGMITINGNDYTLSDKQILLKGANLENTTWALGLVCYTGEDSKIMLNSQQGRQKMSHMEVKVNQLVLYIIASQALFCVAMSVGSYIWQE